MISPAGSVDEVDEAENEVEPGGSFGGDAEQYPRGMAGGIKTVGSDPSVDRGFLGSFELGLVLWRGMSTLAPQWGQIPLLPAKNALTFSLWPFGQ